ncbi:MAG: peroxiredoxin [Frankia sp.]|nr:peroxiredoxin [Frankia sp.]
MPDVGEHAPDFTLPGTSPGGPRDYTLSAERGHPVVLAFYPGDNTAVCTAQLCSYQDQLSAFTDLDAVVWGISEQDLDSHERFAEKRHLTFPLLADPEGRATRRYGVHAPLRLKRSVFVVDAAGAVAWRHVSTIGLTYQSTSAIARVLRELAVAS